AHQRYSLDDVIVGPRSVPWGVIRTRADPALDPHAAAGRPGVIPDLGPVREPLDLTGMPEYLDHLRLGLAYDRFYTSKIVVVRGMVQWLGLAGVRLGHIG